MKAELLAPEKAAPGSAAFCLKKILVGIDFSPASKQAFAYAVRLAQQFQASVILLHVLEPVPLPVLAGLTQTPALAKTDSDAETNLRALVAQVGTDGKKGIRCKVRSGLATHEIVAVAREADVDLVVVGTHGFTSGKHFCIGTTAERVARAAPCPVLVVREKEYEF